VGRGHENLADPVLDRATQPGLQVGPLVARDASAERGR